MQKNKTVAKSMQDVELSEIRRVVLALGKMQQVQASNK
jgi:hypothetical protein